MSQKSNAEIHSEEKPPMFKKKSNAAMARQASFAAPSPARRTGYEPFRFSENSFDFQFTHPRFQGYSTWYGLKDGATVTVITPFFRGQDALRYALVDLAPEHWLQL